MKFPSANGYVFMRDVILSRQNRPRSRFSRFVRRMFQANFLLENDEMEMRRNISANRGLLAKLQLPGNRLVTICVRVMEIIQQTPALADHFEQSPPRTVVLDVFLKVLGQMVDPLRQQSNLNVRR